MKPTAPSEVTCAICGKDTSGGRGFMTLYLNGRALVLCCPLCKKAHEENPGKFAQARKTGDAIREIERGLGMDPSG